MDYRRIVLLAALAVVAFFLWQAWQKDYPANAVKTVQSTAIPSSLNVPPPSANQVLAGQNKDHPLKPAEHTAVDATGQIITVKTDVLNVKINTLGGNFVETDLLKYPQTINDLNNPVHLLNSNNDTLYTAQSGLLSTQGPDTTKGQAQYTTEKSSYVLQPGESQLNVVLNWKNNQGLIVTKTFTFKRGEYAIPLSYKVVNQTKKDWLGQIYGQIRYKPQNTGSSIFSLHTFTGFSLSTQKEPYDKLSFSKLDEEAVSQVTTGGWLALQQRYFLSAWVPQQTDKNIYYSSVDNNKIYSVGFLSPSVTVPAGHEQTLSSTFYTGPEIAENLTPLAQKLDLTIDYGWLWPISVAIFWVMKHIYEFVGNWGWSIVLVTLLIKLAFYKLSEVSYRSMAKMRLLTPKMQALKERYGDDRQKMSQATMELYRKEKVNPLGGCLPILIQIPFFIALYYVLIESVELRQAPFIFWIHDLAIHDPYYVLPILMGISMFIQQKLNPAPPDPTQAKVMMILPVAFTLFFLAFPAGLVLYWLVNNCLSILQQWYIMRRVEAQVNIRGETKKIQ